MYHAEAQVGWVNFLVVLRSYVVRLLEGFREVCYEWKDEKTKSC